MAHIRIDKDLPEDARTLELADAILAELRRLAAGNALHENGPESGNALTVISRLAAIGAVTKLWIHGDSHVREDNTLDVTLEQLSEVTALPIWLLRGFSVRWLRVTEKGVTQLPEYVEKNALISREKRREQSRKRVKKWRAKHKKSGNALHGKKRKKRNGVTRKTGNANVTHPRAGARARVTGTGTETTETRTGTGTVLNGASLAAGRGAAAPRRSLEEEQRDRFGCVLPMAAKGRAP